MNHFQGFLIYLFWARKDGLINGARAIYTTEKMGPESIIQI